MPSSPLSTFPVLLACFLAATGLKLLLVPSYRSTDFEVHRNWLALTHSLPLQEWYFEATSEWTLDYPPFFAYFERLLAWAAHRLLSQHDPGLLRISAEPYVSDATVWFQRGSVMATDLLLLLGVWANAGCCAERGHGQPRLLLLAVLTLGSAGLLVVDHMHFQYNGYLMGMLLLSVACIRRGRPYLSAALFAALLMSKHLFLALAPAYFVHLLRNQCFATSPLSTTIPAFRPLPFLALGATVLIVFGLALGPFVTAAGGMEPAIAQLQQIVARLFPFGRGLVHAYWAPNAYSFYCLTDLTLGFVGRRLRLLPPRAGGKASWASGLVQVVQPEALPEITPLITALLTLGSMSPALWRLWTRPPAHKNTFVLALFHCSLGAFMLGWHVHEKAIIAPALLLALLAPDDPRCAHLAFWLAAIGHASLLPLFPPLTADALTAYLLLHAHTLLAWALTIAAHEHNTALQWPWHEVAYFVGLQATLLFELFLHPWLLAARFPFLARMLCSVYCAVGIAAVWLRSYWLLFEEEKEDVKEGRGELVTNAKAAKGRKSGGKVAAALREEEEEEDAGPAETKTKSSMKGPATARKAKPPKEETDSPAVPERRSRRLRGGKEK